MNARFTLTVLIGLCLGLFPSFTAKGQVCGLAYDEVKNNIVTKFNNRDFTGIYQLFDIEFKNKISEKQLVNFLKANQNSGKILKSSCQSETDGVVSYLLELELRDIVMKLKATPEGKISSFGLVNVPPVFLETPPSVKTDNPRRSELDKAIDSLALEYFRYAKANSLTIGIIKNGKRHIYKYGEIERNNGRLPSSQTLYEIGSITKTFTATILAQAVLDKEVSLADDIRKYLPGTYPNLSYEGTPITIQDLANHTSGLPTLPEDIGDQRNYDPLTPESNYDSAMAYDALRKVSLSEEPGRKFLYSNWGITLLGHILEKVYKQSHNALVSKFVTGPLGMKKTGYVANESGLEIAAPHSENGRRIPLDKQGYFSPAGGLTSTIEDMIDYLDAQIKETRPSVKLTHQPTANNTGLGWGVRKKETSRHIEHNGSAQGSTAHISAFPEINGGCVILANNKVNLGKLIVGIQGILQK